MFKVYPDNSDSTDIFDSIPECIEYLINRFSILSELHVVIQGPTRWKVTIKPMISEHIYFIDEVSLTELADAKKKELGLTTYDTALPITWCDDVKARTGEWPHHFVWGYTKEIFGTPIPLTPAAQKLLERYEEVRK